MYNKNRWGSQPTEQKTRRGGQYTMRNQQNLHVFIDYQAALLSFIDMIYIQATGWIFILPLVSKKGNKRVARKLQHICKELLVIVRLLIASSGARSPHWKIFDVPGIVLTKNYTSRKMLEPCYIFRHLNFPVMFCSAMPQPPCNKLSIESVFTSRSTASKLTLSKAKAFSIFLGPFYL